jgi:hypothetical protein
MLPHYPLAYKISVEKSPDNLMEVALYVTSHFSLGAFSIPFVFFFNFGQFDYSVPW